MKNNPLKVAKAGQFRAIVATTLLSVTGLSQAAEPTYAWRYYRPGNTGIQGDYCDSLWVSPNGDPWIGGYDASFEEGGISKLIQSENRWLNVSNIDYPEIGHPENTGTTRARDITPDAQGNLWMGTGRGMLKYNPSIGPSSLKRFGADNSPWPGGWVTNIEMAPDGTIWASGYATVWGGGGLARFNPATSAWTFLGQGRPEMLAITPKPGGGYYVWAADRPGSIGETQRFDSATQSWTTIPNLSGNPRNIPSARAVDAAGNMWIHRVLPNNFDSVLDVRRPDGTWVGVPPIPGGGGFALHAFGNMQAIADSEGQIWRFDGTTWIGLGDWGNINWTYDLGIDSTGAVWACGVGGAAKRDPATGVWQRYRVTNTSQYDSFNEGLSIDQATGDVYACANAGPGAGGMVQFKDGRWIGFNELQYGLGHPWPFPTDNSQEVFFRPSTGTVIANPTFNSTWSFNGTTWSKLNGGSDTVVGYVEDSQNRLWGLGEYFSLGTYQSGTFNNYSIAAWGQRIQKDPDRPGTVWANAGYEVARTDGVYRFSRTIDDFPQLTSQSDTFSGLAVDAGGVAWLGCTVMFGAGGDGGALIKLDADTGAYTMLRYDQGWPFPGQFVSPLAVTPDGRVWMQYDSDFLTAKRGLCWYDGTNVGDFPAPPFGDPQWGGLPHAQISSFEVKPLPDGYELWMVCKSRGIAVLTVTYDNACYADCDATGTLSIDDFICFQTLFAIGDPSADCDSSGTLSIDDFICFQTFFALGC